MFLIDINKNIGFCWLTIVMMVFITSCKSRQAESHSQETSDGKELYTCSMHPEIIRNKPGTCPICGMTLVKKEQHNQKLNNAELEDLLKPTNEFVITSVPVITIERKSVQIAIEALGSIKNDTREIGAISAKVTGRIEKIYVRYRYQMIEPGQKIMEIYSPEVVTAEQNLLFLLKNDSLNSSLIQATKEKLLLMGMSIQQLNELITSRKSSLTISLYSNFMGHIHESGLENMEATGKMQESPLKTVPLTIREGMYVTTGQRIFSITDPQSAWAVLNIFPENQYLVKVGNLVKLTPEANPLKVINAKINFVEPFYREGSKSLTARVYFDNSVLNLPIGSQVRAKILGSTINANWLPGEAVLSLGVNNITFVKKNNGFVPRKVETGAKQDKWIQIIEGLKPLDSVASNAQYIIDSESFIKVK